jgi:hypothetical protein
MSAITTQDQGIIDISHMDYVPRVIDSFHVDRKAQGLSGETIQFYQKKLHYFLILQDAPKAGKIVMVMNNVAELPIWSTRRG